jgi:hypothetical protein
VARVSGPRCVHLISAHEVVPQWRLYPTYTAECGELVESAREEVSCPNECECEVIYCSACLRAAMKRNCEARVDVDCPPGVDVRSAR